MNSESEFFGNCLYIHCNFNDDYITMSRQKSILQRLSIYDYDALLVTKPENVTYLTGFSGDSSHLIISTKGCKLITDGRYTEQANQECGEEVEILNWIDNNRYGLETYQSVIDRLEVNRLAFESGSLTHSEFNKLHGGLKKITLIPTEGLIEELRQIKDDTEVSFLREACRISDKALELTIPNIKPGISEIELTARLEYNIKTLGADDISFTTIVLSGKNTSLLHGKPDRKKINNGDFLLFDFGALYKGYHADISRTFIVGKASVKQKLLYDIIQKAQKAAVEIIKSGTPGNKPDEIIREIIPDEYIDYYYPGLGHGVGLDIHERPFIKKEADFIFKEGMVVTIEPGIYIPGWGGLRIEDTILVKKDSAETLSHFPRE